MSEIFIPTMLFWENGNTWYGSLGNTRFYAAPQEEQIHVQQWRGPLTKELSEIKAEADFPLSEEGLAEMTAWLEEHTWGSISIGMSRRRQISSSQHRF